MKSYAVYTPPTANLTPTQVAEKTIFIPQGFCWPAFLFSGLWLLYRKQWLAFVAYVAVVVLFAFMGQFMGLTEGAQSILSLLLNLLLGFEGRTLQALDLERRGYTRIDTVFAPQHTMAEYRFFSKQEFAQ